MALKHNIGLAFAVLASGMTTVPAQAEDLDAIGGFFERGAAATFERSKTICLAGLSTNGGQILTFPQLRQQPERDVAELLSRTAMANAALVSVCVAETVAESGADAYLFLGSTVDQPRVIILNGKLPASQQEEALQIALTGTREFFSRYNQNQIGADVLTQPRAVKLLREGDKVTGAAFDALPIEHLGVAINLFKGGEAYFIPQITPEDVTPVSDPAVLKPPASETRPAFPDSAPKPL